MAAPKKSSKQKKYVQFSKKIVVAVTISVTVICAIAMFLVADSDYIAQIVKTYVGFAMVVFASYSGNSIAEKIVLQKYNNNSQNEENGEC